MIGYERFQTLRPEARDVVLGLRDHSCDARSHFERFMFLWMSFNGWMSCVTDGDFDSKMIAELADDRPLIDAFERIVLDGRERDTIHEFAQWWPIFDVKTARKTIGVDGLFQHRHRDDFYEAHGSNPKIKRKPTLWIPGQRPRWQDVIWAIYQVRCNLFHGDKASYNPGDVEIVRLAHDALFLSIEQLDLYGLGPQAAVRPRRRAG